jgi:hypothetical protein
MEIAVKSNMELICTHVAGRRIAIAFISASERNNLVLPKSGQLSKGFVMVNGLAKLMPWFCARRRS